MNFPILIIDFIKEKRKLEIDNRLEDLQIAEHTNHRFFMCFFSFVFPLFCPSMYICICIEDLEDKLRNVEN